MLGVLLVDKPQGLTSHDVVNQIRRRFGTRRVGHAGTLDPLATGLLVVAVGPATRFLQYLPLEPKVYEAEIAFGRASTTYDAEGELTEEREVPADLAGALAQILPRFTGLIEQMPPMFSAIKIKGQPLYKYARLGKEIERTARTVHIGRCDVSSVEGACVRVTVECSGGTYIRSLAHDLGEALGCGAYLASLRRTKVGKFGLKSATPLAQVDPSRLIPLAEALPPMPLFELDQAQSAHIMEGRAIQLPKIESDVTTGEVRVALTREGQVFSIARLEGNALHPECVIPCELLGGHI
jgi:tRNA pseudouridine55 synthase